MCLVFDKRSRELLHPLALALTRFRRPSRYSLPNPLALPPLNTTKYSAPYSHFTLYKQGKRIIRRLKHFQLRTIGSRLGYCFGSPCNRSDVLAGPADTTYQRVNKIRRFCFRCSLTEVKRISPVVSAPPRKSPRRTRPFA